MMKKILPILLAPLLLAGCATTFTNLTPTQQLRNADNLYPVEVRFDTRQKSLRWDSIQPFVAVGDQTYPMQKVPMMYNRWECLVPVPAGESYVQYRYKFDFLYNEFGGPQLDTAISRRYDLQISEK